MKKMLRQICTAVLAFTLVVGLASCAKSQPSAKVAMGRYVETALPLPEGLVMILGFQPTTDGGVNLIGYRSADGTGHDVHLGWYSTHDVGRTWKEEDCTKLDLLLSQEDGPGRVEAMTWGKDDRLYLYTSNESTTEESDAPANKFHYVEDSGELVTLDWKGPVSENGAGLQDFRVADCGNVLANYFGELKLLDGETGAVLSDLADGSNILDGYTVNGNTAAVSQGDRIQLFDLTTGKETGNIPVTASPEMATRNTEFYRVMSPGPEGTLFFADATGLYRALPESAMVERLADGSVTSLGTPALSRIALADGGEGRFLLLGYSDRYQLLSYTYDPNVPTLPNQEVKVYSLYDDPLIRQAMGGFQQQNPEIHISYQMGLEEGSAMTREDALRTLNTELTAGKGPDVLLLDGLPMEDYIEKGVLADLSTQIKPLMDRGELLPNIAGTYLEADGGMYAVPAQFTVPLLHGTPEAVDAIHSLEDMALWLEDNRDSYNHPLTLMTPEDYLSFFYPVCEGSLFGVDGTADRAAFSTFLSSLKKIYEREQECNVASGMFSSLEFDFGALPWFVDAAGLDVGNLSKFQGLYAAWQMSQKKGGSIDTLFGGSNYLPVTVLGVSAQSKEDTAARRFVEAILSQEVQEPCVGNGIPVNTAVFERTTQLAPESQVYSDEEGAVYSTYGTTVSDEEGAMVPINATIHYPLEAYRMDFANRLRALDTPLTVDGALLQIITADTADFFKGTAELEPTLNKLMDKIQLYQAE